MSPTHKHIFSPNEITKGAILKGIDACTGNSKGDFSAVRLHVEKIFNKSTPSYELDLMKTTIEFMQVFRLVDKIFQTQWKVCMDKTLQVLFEQGYRKEIETPLEHALISSSNGGQWRATYPLRPIGVITGELTVPEAQRARALRITGDADVWNYDIETGYLKVPIALEKLNESGDAVRLPRVLNMDKLTVLLKKGVSLEDAFVQSELPVKRSANYPVYGLEN